MKPAVAHVFPTPYPRAPCPSWALTRLCLLAGYRRPGAPVADPPHSAGVHGAEAGARHQAVPSDREGQGGFLCPVRQLTPPAPPAVPVMQRLMSRKVSGTGTSVFPGRVRRCTCFVPTRREARGPPLPTSLLEVSMFPKHPGPRSSGSRRV